MNYSLNFPRMDQRITLWKYFTPVPNLPSYGPRLSQRQTVVRAHDYKVQD